MTQQTDRKDLGLESLGKIHPALAVAAKNLSERSRLPLDVALKLEWAELLFHISDIIIPGSPVSPASQYLIDTAKVENRIVSFLLDGQTHIGTGILISPVHVLTTAHLFFEASGGFVDSALPVRLIDPTRPDRLTVVVHTTLLSDIMFKTPDRTTKLVGTPACFLDPRVTGITAEREVDKLDFAIVRLVDPIGNDGVSQTEQRGWFDIPTANQAPVLASDDPMRVFQYIDAKEPRVSAGVFRDFTEDGLRVGHTASTLDGASGSPAVNDQGDLLAMHVSGPLSGARPRSNFAIPVALIAQAIDTPDDKGVTIRSLLNT